MCVNKTLTCSSLWSMAACAYYCFLSAFAKYLQWTRTRWQCRGGWRRCRGGCGGPHQKKKPFALWKMLLCMCCRNLLAKTSKIQVAHSCPPASPTMRSLGPSVSFHFSYTQKKLSFLNILEFKIVSVTCGTITRQGTLPSASSDRGQAIHSWALNWNIVIAIFLLACHPRGRLPQRKNAKKGTPGGGEGGGPFHTKPVPEL